MIPRSLRPRMMIPRAHYRRPARRVKARETEGCDSASAAALLCNAAAWRLARRPSAAGVLAGVSPALECGGSTPLCPPTAGIFPSASGRGPRNAVRNESGRHAPLASAREDGEVGDRPRQSGVKPPHSKAGGDARQGGRRRPGAAEEKRRRAAALILPQPTYPQDVGSSPSRGAADHGLWISRRAPHVAARPRKAVPV